MATLSPILVVTAKPLNALDRAALNSYPDQEIHIVEKAGFNRGRFVAEVRRAICAKAGRVPDGKDIDC